MEERKNTAQPEQTAQDAVDQVSAVRGEIENEEPAKTFWERIRDSRGTILGIALAIVGIVIVYFPNFLVWVIIVAGAFLVLRIAVMFLRKQNDIWYRYLLWLVFSSLEKKKYDISVFEQRLSRKALKQRAIKKPYRLKSRRLYYEYISREEIYHSKVFRLVAKTDELESFTDRFVFSGDSVPTPEALYAGQRIEQLDKDHGWNFYRIHFHAERGKSLSAGMKMPRIMDLNHKAKTFLSTGIYEPTQELVMTVRFDEATIKLVKNVYFLTFNNYVDMNPIAYELLQIDYVHSCVTKRVKYPIYHYKYMIKWTFEE